LWRWTHRLESNFSTSEQLRKQKRSSIPSIPEGSLPDFRGPAQNPPSSRHKLRALPIPVLAAPKRVLAAFERLRSNPTYPDAQRAHIGIKDTLNNEVKLAFGKGDLSWKPGHLRSAYGAICCHRFKPKNMTDDIFLAQILGHKLLPSGGALSVGQSYKDFYVVGSNAG
jgi:Telomere resolvase